MKHLNHAPITQISSRHALSLLTFCLLLATACAGGGAGEEPAIEAGGGTAPPHAATSTEKPDDSGTNGDGDAVEYEPAYPEEVSKEGLSEDDVKQQHDLSHGDEEHGADHEHEHGEEGAHSHGDDGGH